MSAALSSPLGAAPSLLSELAVQLFVQRDLVPSASLRCGELLVQCGSRRASWEREAERACAVLDYLLRDMLPLAFSAQGFPGRAEALRARPRLTSLAELTAAHGALEHLRTSLPEEGAALRAPLACLLDALVFGATFLVQVARPQGEEVWVRTRGRFAGLCAEGLEELLGSAGVQPLPALLGVLERAAA